MKRKKIIKLVADTICHDPFAYDPKWKWSSLPKYTKIEYKQILPILQFWEKKGYITLLECEDYAFIVHPEKLPKKEELIQLSQNVQ